MSLAAALRSGAGRARRALEQRRLRRRLAGPRLLGAFADVHPDAVVVEIGANDGLQHDHLRPFLLGGRWRGVLVEPVPYVFARLQANYARVDGVTLENAAIGARDGRMPFWFLVDAGEEERARLPEWYDGIGSFSKDFVLGHAKHMPDIAERLRCEEVPTLTFESLCAKHGLERVDLLVVDTEGHDWEILRRIDLEARRPSLVVYEHFHLSEEDRRSCRAHLRDAGYETLEEGFDTFCLSIHADARLRRLWGDLEPAIPGVTVRDERA